MTTLTRRTDLRHLGAALGACIIALAVAQTPSRAATDLTQPGPWLVFDFALGWGMGPADYDGRGGVRFEIQASTGGPFERLFRADYARLQWYPCAVNVAKYAGQEVRFRFIVEHLDGRIMMDYPHWGNPRLVTGPLAGGSPPTEAFNFAMTPMGRAGAILPDGTEVPLTEADETFAKGLVTPGRLSRDLMLLVYAGDNYICIPGKRQPGIYMGVSMSTDYLRIGAGPDRAPWTGRMPPPVFAEWTAKVPPAPPAASAPKPVAAPAPGRLAQPGVAQVLQTKTDTWKYTPGIAAHADADRMTLEAGMGPQASHGWAFAGMELVGLAEVPLRLERRGSFSRLTDNSFGGLLVDYHSPRGYEDRVWLGLGAGGRERYDLRPADWILDGPPLALPRTMGLRTQFVDLSGQAKQTSASLRLKLATYAPPDWDGRIWLAAGVQDLAAGAALKATVISLKATPPPPQPSTAGESIVLRDEAAEFVISKRNGAIVGGTDRRTGQKLMAACNDRYAADSEHDVTRTTELLDRVRKADTRPIGGRPGLVVTCDNVALPGVTIEKRYVLLPGRVLSKRVAFSTTDPKGFFIHWDAETSLNPAFAAKSSRGGDLGDKQVVAGGKVVAKTEKVMAEQVSAGDAPMATATDYSLGLAAYRLHVNDRFVLRGTAKALPNGWLNGALLAYVKAGKPASADMRWLVFAGDFTAVDRHYQALPEYRKLWDFPRPAWPLQVVTDAMCIGPPESYPMYRAANPDVVTTTIWFLNPPWGNWGPDSDPPLKLHPDVKGIAPSWRHEFPNSKVSAYTNALFDDKSDIYKNHLDFAVRDLEGQPITSGISSDAGGRPTFYFQINNPVCRQYLLDMHAAKFKGWSFDFFYMDGPGFAAEVADWGTRDVAQSYDWLDYFKALRERLQALKPEAAMFVNGVNLPYTDIGYIEYRDEQWAALSSPKWRSLAMELLRMKLNEEPGFVTVPTYGNPNADPALAAYTLLYGWCGHGIDVGRLPWMREAHARRGIRLVEDAVEPRWWRSDVDFEALGFRQGAQALVNVLDHGTAAREVTVRVDTSRLGLREGAPINAELRLMNDTASDLQPDPADAKKQVRVWRNKEAVTVRPLFAGKACPKILELTVPTRPMLLTTVVLTQPGGDK